MSDNVLGAVPGTSASIPEKKFSIIIPHKNATHLITRLLDSIPASPDIEIIIVDDSSTEDEKRKLREFDFGREVVLIFETAAKGAGRARNTALKHATGKWLLFADADDYFAGNMLSLIEKYYNAEEDIIFFGTGSVFNDDITQVAYRHQRYLKLVSDFVADPSQDNEDALRYYFNPPWGKLIRRQMVEQYNLRFQEILASNDIYFSITSANRARKIAATTDVLYIITVTPGSISNSFSKEHFDTRFNAALQANDFLRSINKRKYQQSVLYYLARSHAFGWKYVLYVMQKLVQHRSNIFIGIEKIVGYKKMLSQRENPSFVPKK
ncbi:glycosyltransferase family A protein [Dyadobacter sandarakinus]|uniref:Glycosyltransferase family 2 protein n=1 Tax=Dyadobacter sandarakinus TaxID=2747268 RepID=A0ABX7I198_9BACT|nr:glycosyltransferase family A protein [Dyadobacter sandarakinus]QRQ99457.1 glycosyltransferase family 2 protein [Dyadobacter sandarakinus]